MKILFVGPQGSGKGTQAQIISKKFEIPHISAGDLLRNATGDIKKEIDMFINQGLFVPDSLIIQMIKIRISEKDCQKGFILDGFPRNIAQTKEMDKVIKIDKVIEISISDEEAVGRIAGRLNCLKCSTVFNIKTNPPKEENRCDKCGSELFTRKDDTEEAIKKRLEIYHKETEPILKHYPSLRINGEQPIEKVTEDILRVLNFF